MQHISDAKAEAVKAEYEAKDVAVAEASEKARKDWICL